MALCMENVKVCRLYKLVNTQVFPDLRGMALLYSIKQVIESYLDMPEKNTPLLCKGIIDKLMSFIQEINRFRSFLSLNLRICEIFSLISMLYEYLYRVFSLNLYQEYEEFQVEWAVLAKF